MAQGLILKTLKRRTTEEPLGLSHVNATEARDGAWMGTFFVHPQQNQFLPQTMFAVAVI